MKTKLETFESAQEHRTMDIRPGDTVRVHQKITEGERQRIQIFEGLVLAHKHGAGIRGTITVRKVSSGVGIERIFPLQSTSVEKFEVVKRAKVRRAKLYYLRDARGRKARLKAKALGVAVLPEEVSAPTEEDPAKEVPSEEQAASA